MRFGRFTVVLFLLALTVSLVASAQPGGPNGQVVIVDNEYVIKAKYLYFLTVFVQPTAAAPSPVTAKRIAVIGRRIPKFWETTKQYQKLTISNPPIPIVWQEFADVATFQSSANEPWDLVFLIQDEAEKIDSSLSRVHELLQGKEHVLIVTEQDDQFRKLAAVNFYEDTKTTKVRIQIRLQSLEERKLVGRPEFLKNDAVIVYAPQSTRS